MNKSASTRIERLNNRTIFADIAVQKKNVKDGRLLRPIYVTDHTAGILTEIDVGAVETTPAELARYVGPDRPQGSIPAAPTGLLAVIADSSVLITFTAGSDGGSPITDYEYSLDEGAFVSLGATGSPVIINGLTNGQNYSIVLRAVNAVGPGSGSDPLSVTPAWVPEAPYNLVGTPGNGQVSIAFSGPDSDRGSAITNFKYSLNNGDSYSAFSPAVFGSPVTITGLSNGTTYQIALRAVNSIGDGDQSSVISVTPSSAVNHLYLSPTTNVGVSIGTNSPFVGGGESYEFNGSSDYLTLSADNSWAMGTGNFTIEWFQYQTDNNPFPRVFATGSDSIGCSIESAGTILYPWINGDYPTSATITNVKNQWVHFAIVRNGGTLYVYKDGVSQANGASSDDITDNTSTLYIGVQKFPTTFITWFGGYITNFRIVKGVAVYTGNFTVPTSKLTITATANPYGGSNTAAIPIGATKLLLLGTPQPTIFFDPGNVSSYPGSGTSITSIGMDSSVVGTMTGVSYNAGSGGYLTFNGTNINPSYIDFPEYNFGSAPSYNFGGAISLIAWVQPTARFSINTLFATANPGLSTAGIKLGWNAWETQNQALLFEGGNGSQGNASLSAENTVVNGAWQQITYVFVQNPPSVNFYKNGVLLTSSATPVVDISMISSWRIGDMFGAYYMFANLGLFKLYSAPLTLNDIQTEYNANCARYGLSPLP